jgi:hypothetical protein
MKRPRSTTYTIGGGVKKAATIRTFKTGATRDTDHGKPDYEAFDNPLVDEAFGAYMHRHRVQPDGALRDGDNWQKGFPRDVVIKSLCRHVLDLRKLHRGYPVVDPKTGEAVTLLDALCAIRFNVNAYILELVRPTPTRRRR